MFLHVHFPSCSGLLSPNSRSFPPSQPWLLWDIPDPCTPGRQQLWVCGRGPHLLPRHTCHVSNHSGFQCPATTHAADDPAFGRKWKLTGIQGSNPSVLRSVKSGTGAATAGQALREASLPSGPGLPLISFGQVTLCPQVPFLQL